MIRLGTIAHTVLRTVLSNFTSGPKIRSNEGPGFLSLYENRTKKFSKSLQ